MMQWDEGLHRLCIDQQRSYCQFTYIPEVCANITSFQTGNQISFFYFDPSEVVKGILRLFSWLYEYSTHPWL